MATKRYKIMKMCIAFLRIGESRIKSNLIKEYPLEYNEGTLRVGNVYIHNPEIKLTRYIAFITGNGIYIHVNNVDMDELQQFLFDNGVLYSFIR